MKTIPLTQEGMFATVDDEDYARLLAFSWRPVQSGARKTWYACTGVQSIRMHRLILADELTTSLEVDHINGDGLDNRRANLRVCTRAQNACAQRTRKGFKGTWQIYNGRWRAGIKKDRQQVHLGYFDSKEEAMLMYDLWACEIFGEFAVTNFQVVSFG